MEKNELSALNNPTISNQESSNLPNLPSDFKSNHQGTYEQINQLFNEKDQQGKIIQEARDILGESSRELTDEQVYDMVNEIQYLVDSWLEEFERKTFDGKTLNELLNLEQ